MNRLLNYKFVQMFVNLTDETIFSCSLYEENDGKKKKVLQIQYILLKIWEFGVPYAI